MVEPVLRDNGTVSGTYVNGQKIDMTEHPEGLLLENRDVITFGTCKSLHIL